MDQTFQMNLQCLCIVWSWYFLKLVSLFPFRTTSSPQMMSLTSNLIAFTEFHRNLWFLDLWNVLQDIFKHRSLIFLLVFSTLWWFKLSRFVFPISCIELLTKFEDEKYFICLMQSSSHLVFSMTCLCLTSSIMFLSWVSWDCDSVIVISDRHAFIL